MTCIMVVLSFSDSLNYYIKDGEHTLLPYQARTEGGSVGSEEPPS